MEAVSGLQAVDTGGILPGRAVVSCPLHQIVEFLPTAEEAGVQDIIHVVFIFAVDLDRGGRWLSLAGERVAGGVFQQGHMEYLVDSHGAGEVESSSIWCAETGVGHDLERSEAAVVGLAGRPAGHGTPGV